MEGRLKKLEESTLKHFADDLQFQKKIMSLLERVEKKLDCHIEKVEPILEGLELSKTMVKVTLWISGIVVTMGGAYLTVRKIVQGV